MYNASDTVSWLPEATFETWWVMVYSDVDGFEIWWVEIRDWEGVLSDDAITYAKIPVSEWN